MLEQGRRDISDGIKAGITNTKMMLMLMLFFASGTRTQRSVDTMSVKMLLKST